MTGIEQHCKENLIKFAASILFKLVEKNPNPDINDLAVRVNYDGVPINFCKMNVSES